MTLSLNTIIQKYNRNHAVYNITINRQIELCRVWVVCNSADDRPIEVTALKLIRTPAVS